MDAAVGTSHLAPGQFCSPLFQAAARCEQRPVLKLTAIQVWVRKALLQPAAPSRTLTSMLSLEQFSNT